MTATAHLTQAQAYDECCRIAREHALILSAVGGVVTFVHPDTQKEEGLYEHIQYIHGLGPHPKSAEYAALAKAGAA